MGKTIVAPGEPYASLVIPDLIDLSRTAVVNLTPLQGNFKRGDKIVVGCKGLDTLPPSVDDWRKMIGEEGFVYAKFENESLPVQSLTGLLDVIDESWETSARWRNSTLYAQRVAFPT